MPCARTCSGVSVGGGRILFQLATALLLYRCRTRIRCLAVIGCACSRLTCLFPTPDRVIKRRWRRFEHSRFEIRQSPPTAADPGSSYLFIQASIAAVGGDCWDLEPRVFETPQAAVGHECWITICGCPQSSGSTPRVLNFRGGSRFEYCFFVPKCSKRSGSRTRVLDFDPLMIQT